VQQRSYKAHICTQSATYATLSQGVPRQLYKMQDSGRVKHAYTRINDQVRFSKEVMLITRLKG